MKDSALQPGVAKYFRIAEDLRAQITSGDLAVGERLPSYAAMKQQGLSQTTIEKAYALLEADGLIQRSNGNGVYVAQRRAEQKKTSGLIGFVGFSGTQPQHFGMHYYGAHLQEGAREAAKAYGCHLMLMDTEADEAACGKLDGILTAEGIELPPRMNGLPRVLLLNELDGVTSVVADECGGVTQAVEHLVGLGHRRIGYLLADGGQPGANRRLAAYRRALKAHDIAPDPSWLNRLCAVWEYPTLFVGAARATMTKWLNQDWHKTGCTALLCQNDQTAIGAITALRGAGVRVPEDVSVVGFDGTEAAALIQPALTTVQMPLYEIGGQGARALLQKIAGKEEISNLVLETRLIGGESTARAAQ